jgi:hypothetical protein
MESISKDKDSSLISKMSGKQAGISVYFISGNPIKVLKQQIRPLSFGTAENKTWIRKHFNY